MESNSGKPSDTLTIEVVGHGEFPMQGLSDREVMEFSNQPDAMPQWPAWLLNRGPVIRVSILSSDGARSQQGVAHVDTGGRWTLVESRVAELLGLEETGDTVSAQVPSVGLVPCKVHDGKVSFNGGLLLRWRLVSIPIVPKDRTIGHQNTILVLGRDLLQFGRFEYDGESGEFSLSLWIPADAQPTERP